jgi:transposase-like protein
MRIANVFEDSSITVTCPECGRKSEHKIAQVKDARKYVCPACSRTIEITPRELRIGLFRLKQKLGRL